MFVPLLLAHGPAPTRSPWTWQWHPDVMIVMVLVVAPYVWVLTRLGRRLVGPGEDVISRRQIILLTTSLGSLWGFAVWPVHGLAEGYSYTVHMVQHTVYTSVVPPLVILGTPVWLWRWALRPVLPVFGFLVRPSVAVIGSSAIIGATHLPVLVNSAVRSGPESITHVLARVVPSRRVRRVWRATTFHRSVAVNSLVGNRCERLEHGGVQPDRVTVHRRCRPALSNRRLAPAAVISCDLQRALSTVLASWHR